MRRARHAAAVVAAVVAVVLTAGSAAAFYALTSTPATTTHRVAALSAPQSFTAVPRLVGQDGVVDLSWTRPASPAGAPGLRYTVSRGTVPVCSGILDTVCLDTGLPQGSTHTWSVRPLLAAWTGPAATVSATVPVSRALTVTAPASTVAGTPVNVLLTATNAGAPDTTALGTRTLTVSGPSSVGSNVPTTSVAATFVQRADGSIGATVPVTLVAAENVRITVSEPNVPGRTGTSAPVVVSPQQGSSVFADCQGPPGYVCGSGDLLAGSVLTGVVQRSAVDPLGNPLPLPAETLTLTIKNDLKGDLTQLVTFAAGETVSARWSFTPEPGAKGNLRITATAPTGRSAPAPLSVRL